ncbi:MAG: bifunctional riboflavin kinase/FAD synthetase [Oscillospiraceae bacterium]|nr:bifunctional riboflavin kinase/FAD synthetase [Oscillospiraceae bacterium]
MKKSVALGLFDGLHIGHRAVIGKAAELARENGLTPAVFTFEPSTGERIITADFKQAELCRMGIRDIFSPDFEAIKNLSPDEFIKNILVAQMNAAYVTCGEDFRFGKNASGGAWELEKICGNYGIKLSVVPDVKAADGTRISSTQIRSLIREGKMKEANALLGFSFQIKALVSQGRRIGRTINFPTINQALPPLSVIPRFGVYATLTELDGKNYNSITNVGIKPTVSDTGKISAETHILSFSGDLYGRTATLHFLDHIRDEIKFANINELAAQIKKDIVGRDALGAPYI